jgi:hypothetical protein
VMMRHGGDVTEDPMVEMLQGHACIRGLVMRLSNEVVDGNVGPKTLREIGISWRRTSVSRSGWCSLC